MKVDNAIAACAPERGEDFQVIADDFRRLIVPGLHRWQHPCFFGYFPFACTHEAMLAELYSSSLTSPGFSWSAAPANAELEVIVMDWAAKLLGLSAVFLNLSGVGGGASQSSASESALIAIVAARHRYQREHPGAKASDLVIYVTTQTHCLGIKAGLVLGLPVHVLEVRAEDQYALRGETLRSALMEDERLGRAPLILIATIGTTSSGAVDNLSEVAEVVNDYPSLWIHVDAAWAGVALSCPEYREELYLREINNTATSFCTNFHKWGLSNLDMSALWIRDRNLLTDALTVTSPYLTDCRYCC